MKLTGMGKFKKLTLELDCFGALTFGSIVGALCGVTPVPWWIVLLVLPAVLLLKRVAAAAFVTGMIIAFCSGLMSLAEVKQQEREYPVSSAVSGIVVIRDSRATKVKDVVLKSRVRAEFFGSGNTVSCPVLLKMPEDIAKSGYLYGDRWQIKGVLSVQRTGGFIFDGKDIGRAVPPPYGSAYLLDADSSEVLPAEKSFKRGCFILRETLLRRLMSGMDDDYKSMAARLFLGASDGAPSGVKRDFVLAGIIHLFAVSGMHVAVLAGVVGFALIFLPLKWRCLIAAGVVACYVLLSGMAIPALRAGMMIVLWAVFRAFLYHVPNWNILMLSLSLLCMFEPENITDPGTQYSYGITAALIIGLSALQSFYRSGGAVESLMANSVLLRKRLSFKRRLHRFVMFVAVAVLAFSAGSMLTMLHQKYFLPGSIVTNLAAAMATPLMFAAFIFKQLFGWFGNFADGIGSRVIGCGFWYLRNISALSLELFPPVGSMAPGIAAAVLFYILFFAGLKLKNFYAALSTISAALLLLFSFPLLNKCQTESLLVLSGSSTHPPLIAYLIPREGRAVVCDLPDSWSGALGANELLRRGCLKAELFFSGGRSANNAGIRTFSSRINITRINLPEEKTTVWFRRNFEKISASLPVPEPLYDRSCQVISSGNGKFYWNFARNQKVFASIEDNGWKIIWERADGTPVETVVPFCNHVLIWESQKKAGFQAEKD